MASVVTRRLFSSPKDPRFLPSTFSVPSRGTACPRPKPSVRGTTKHRNLIASDCQSLADRGFLRFQKSYTPPADVGERITSLVKKLLGSSISPGDNVPENYKFKILKDCWMEFSHSIPNSQLHKIQTIDDIITFYMTPVDTRTPYDALQQMELPPNLHIQPEYVRFHPEDDTKFDGISAYPQSPTVVTGLRSRKKYKGYTCQLPVTYYNDAFYTKALI
ncbi:UNVERIFIED_CONTAM: hypothetical protein PYX00_005131 [Menopon gallinae]|uniref:Large ribosomal subunit protein mL50 n=1 Tax=Menopon gallinae TaxID=328185 RepID=A0AAW2HQS0_9NEOP